jgi:hypothetical protein
MTSSAGDSEQIRRDLADLNRTIKLHPDRMLGREAEALADLARAAELDPGNRSADP